MKTALLTTLIIFLAIGGGFIIIQSKKKVETKNKKLPVKYIQSETLSPQEHFLEVSGFGVLKPRQQTVISPQVSGKVVFVSNKVKQGALVKKNELLFSIEKEDYLLRINQEKANVANAKLAYRQEQAQKVIAKEEWKHIDEEIRKQSKFNDLVLREKQLITRQAQVVASESQLKQAQLNLQRTNIYAPYDSVIIEENISIGNLVNNSSKVITLASKNNFKIITSIVQDDLKFILPINQETKAMIKNVTTQDITLSASLENNSKMAQILVQFTQEDDRESPLLLNDFIEVKFSTHKLTAYKIYNEFIHDNNTLWLNDNGKLKIITVDIFTRQGNYSYFKLQSNNIIEIITSFINSPYEGMILEKKATNK